MKPRIADLELIWGPMFSGKTATVINRLKQASAKGRTVSAVKPVVDIRSQGVFLSHDGVTYPSVDVKDSCAIAAVVKGSELVGIDEVQFFDEGLRDEVAALLRQGIEVIGAGLDLDYRGQPFERTAELAALANSSTRLLATCALCGREAAFTQRLVNGRPAPTADEIIRVGGHDLYQPRCGECFVENAVRPSLAAS